MKVAVGLLQVRTYSGNKSDEKARNKSAEGILTEKIGRSDCGGKVAGPKPSIKTAGTETRCLLFLSEERPSCEEMEIKWKISR